MRCTPALADKTEICGGNLTTTFYGQREFSSFGIAIVFGSLSARLLKEKETDRHL